MQQNEETGLEKTRLTHLLPQFLTQLQENTVNIFAFQRLLRYSYTQLQVFCTVRRRIIVSQNYYLSHGNPLNNAIVKAFITSNFLLVTLRPENQKNLITKVVDLRTNTDVGELAHSQEYHRWAELPAQLTDDPAEVSLTRFAAASNARIDWIVASFSPSNSSQRIDEYSSIIKTSSISTQMSSFRCSASKISCLFKQLGTWQPSL